MGFYGNITNSTRTQFSFDAVYGSRYEMDAAAGEDHVYVGRYVLVEYDSSIGGLDSLINAYKVTDKNLVQDFVFCISPEFFSIDETTGATTIDLSSVIQCGDETKGNMVTKGTIIKIPGSTDADGNLYNQTADRDTNIPTEFWMCTGNTTNILKVYIPKEDGTETVESLSFSGAKWEKIGLQTDTNYTQNFNRDKTYYGTSRGYDSTVWQKVLQNGYEKYVMVAELNTIVPTFDISADAPTQIPLMPHFDTNSTNVYYKLHWQPAWGFRVRSSINMQTPQISPTGQEYSATISTSNADIQFPSDVNISWKKSSYDSATGIRKDVYAKPNQEGTIYWTEADKNSSEVPSFSGAIYFNRDGLSPDYVSKSWDFTYKNQQGSNGNKRRDPSVDPDITLNENYGFVDDAIEVLPSGLSGQTYENHNGVETCAPDTQELSIMLPSVGDAISDVWDLVYGGRACNEAIQKTSKRNKDVEWYDARSVQDRAGLRLVQDGFTYQAPSGSIYKNEQDYYNTANVNTIAGCINSVHDLMGMIIQPYNNNSALTEDLKNNTEDVIYYDKDSQKYYRKDTTYKYTTIPDDDYTFEKIELSEGEFRPDLYFVKDKNNEYVVASGVYNSNQEYYVRKLNKDSSFTKVTLTPFDGRTYYYKNRLSNGMCDYISEEEYHRDKKYYTMESDKIDGNVYQLGTNFELYTYYIWKTRNDEGKLLETPYYTIDYSITGGDYNPDQTYYEIEDVFSLSDVISEPEYTDLYLPGIFYYKAWSKDVYSEVLWDESRVGTTVYIKNNDGTYTEVKNPVNGDTYYEKLHSSGDPYLESEANKEEFEYLIDNTENGVGSNAKKPNSTENKFTNLIDHYMVKAGEKVIETYTEVDFYAQIHFYNNSGYVYEKGTYYIYNESVNNYTLCADEYNEAWDKAGKYFEKQKKYIYTYRGGTIDETNPLHLLPYNSQSVDYIDKKTGERINNYPIDSADHQWHVKKRIEDKVLNVTYYTYIPVTATSIRKQLVDFYLDPNRTDEDRIQYYQVKKSTINQFYYPNIFYYKVGKDKDPKYLGSYILETNKKMVINNKTNYTLAHLKIDEAADCKAIEEGMKFYYPNHFYKQDTYGNYILAQEKNFNSGETYFEDTRYYVDTDTTNIMKHGQVWNTNIKHVPPTITLAKRQIDYTYYELVDFARKLNTIHGMILKMNQLIDAEDEDTRDLNTIQGALNTFDDWISRLDALNSQEFVIVDNYGRMHSAPLSVQQTTEKGGIDHSAGTKSDVTGIKSDIFPQADSFADSKWKNQWLTVNIDGKPTNPQITLRHNYQPVRDTKSTSNVNGNGDTVVLYTPIVDPRGHVVGHNDNTVTLPYGFKTISTNGRGSETTENATSKPTTTNIVADNTQDVLTINSGNKWIRIDTDSNSDTLTIKHDIHNITTTEKTNTDLNNPKSDTITIQDTTYDTAGHVIGNQNHTYTLPYGFKFITTNGRVTKDNVTQLGTQANIVADNTQDILGINSGDEWIKITTDADSDVLTISHDVKNTSVSTSTQNLSSGSNGATFDVVTYNFDNTNHFSSKDTKTITVPNNYGIIAGDEGNTTEATATHDTFTLSGDSWIKTTVSKDKVSFAHQAPQTTNNTTTFSTNSSPALGGTFSVPKVSYDTKGHISSSGTYTIKLPSLEIGGDKKSDDNVLTDLSYTKNGTTFTRTYSKIGDLALTGYSTPTSISEGINEKDTLNVGLGKLQYGINKEINDRKDAIINAINALDFTDNSDKGKFVSAVTQEDGVITTIKESFSPVVTFDTINTSDPSVTVRINGGNPTTIRLPISASNQYGIVKTTSDSSKNTDEMVPTTKAVHDLFDQKATFDYHGTIRSEDANGNPVYEITETSKLLTEIISRIEEIERYIVMSNTQGGATLNDLLSGWKEKEESSTE